jgi:hypothetical protein
MALGPGHGDDMPHAEGDLDLSAEGVLETVFTQYLEKLYQHALKEITDAGFPARQIRWCITVPAIWSQADRDFTRAAAIRAGFPDDDARLLMIAEPEAAAIYCRSQLAVLAEAASHLSTADLEKARFMVVDGGGGTVDITSYRSMPAKTGGFRLAELGKVTGGKLGSEYVNHAFLVDLLEKRFGPDVLAAIARQAPRELARMEEAWESAKVRLGVRTDQDGEPRISRDITIDIPAKIWAMLPADRQREQEAACDGEPYQIVVSSSEAQALLDTVVAPALEKIADQLAEMRANSGHSGGELLLLVGGFARSEYLRAAVQNRFGEETSLLTPPDPAVAVLFGAVSFCYDPSVLWARRAGLTYGVAMAMPFEDGVDPLEKNFRDEEGVRYCAQRFAIAVRAREQVEVDEPFLMVTAPVLRSQPTVQVTLYATRKLDPRYVDEPGCSQLASIEVDLSDSVGRPDDERTVKILLYFGRTIIDVEAEVVSTGEKVKARTTFTPLH